MGLLKRIGKAVKGVVKGVGKIFKPILKTVGKILNSKIGKLIMIAAAIYTGGLALSAGWGAATSAEMAGQSFLTKFVAGSKAFVGALTGMGGAAKAAPATIAGGAADAGAQMGGMIAAGTAPAAEIASGAAGAAGAASGAAQAANAVNTASQVEQPVSALGKLGEVAKTVGGGVLDFAKSNAGGTIIAQGLQGAAMGKAAEQAQKNFELTSGPMNATAYNDLLAKVSNTPTPEGFLARARNVDTALTRPQFPQVVSDPSKVYGEYVTGAPAPAGG